MYCVSNNIYKVVETPTNVMREVENVCVVDKKW